ncbi:MAG: cell division protein ZapA [Paramuribaculum sp.]|nr:cell division protein ZapA [Paramuribaculum sp.]MDE7452601.1 cell division protein ZapA [Paramuribaculum sp.]
MKDKIDINLRIADVALSLTINPEEERLLREAAKGINEAWSSWRSRFRTKSPAEVLAMVTLLFTRSYLALKEEAQRTDRVLDSLEQTIDMLLLEGNSSGKNES